MRSRLPLVEDDCLDDCFCYLKSMIIIFFFSSQISDRLTSFSCVTSIDWASAQPAFHFGPELPKHQHQYQPSSPWPNHSGLAPTQAANCPIDPSTRMQFPSAHPHSPAIAAWEPQCRATLQTPEQEGPRRRRQDQGRALFTRRRMDRRRRIRTR